MSATAVPPVARANRRATGLLLAGAVALTAVALRWWRLGWGLGDETWFPDERLWAARARAFVPISWQSVIAGAASTGNLPYLVYPTLYGYLAGLVTWAASTRGWVAPEEPAFSIDAILIARWISAAASVATVALGGLLARRMYSPGVGLATAALLAVLPFEAMQVHYAAVDTLLTTCVALTLLASWALVQRGTARAALLAGGAAGLAFSTKYTGIAAGAAVGWAIIEHGWRERSLARLLGLALAALAGFAVAVLVACPPCVLRADRMLEAMAWLGGVIARRVQVVPSLGWYGRPCLYQLVAVLPYALGWPLHALALLGLGAALWRREAADRLALATIVPYFVVVASPGLTAARYLLPVFPPLAMLGARVALGPSGRRRAGMWAVGAAWVWALVLAISQVARFSYDQQKAVAGWIGANRPGASVAVPNYLLGFTRLGDYLIRAGLTFLPVREGHWFDDAPDVFVVPGYYAAAVRRDRPGSAAAAALEQLRSGATGYRPAARWEPSWYLQDRLDAWLDPGLGAQVWQGGYGFDVYVRDARAP